jgi:hypothetical protein
MEKYPYGVPPKATPEQEAAVTLYRGLMEEVKIRLKAIETAAMGSTTLHGVIAREVCFLQLRMICELIALGCLVANGDIKEAAPLAKKWSADEIINQLDQLHADFFPIAVHHVLRPSKPTALERVTSGEILTKAELIKLNGICGNELHRGSLKRLLSPKNAPTMHFRDIKDWGDKIAKLLSHHVIMTRDRKSLLSCILWNTDDNGNVFTVLSANMGPSAKDDSGTI